MVVDNWDQPVVLDHHDHDKIDDQVEIHILDRIFQTQNPILILKVTSFWDAVTLRSAKLVCKSWHKIIKDHLCDTQAGRAILRRQLEHCWKCYSPEVRNVEVGEIIVAVAVDYREIVCSTDTGHLKIYDKTSLVLKHSVQRESDNRLAKIALQEHFLAAGFFGKELEFWNRDAYELRETLELEEQIFDLRTSKVLTDIVAVSQTSGKIVIVKIHPDLSLSILNTFDENVRQLPIMDLDGQWLMCGMVKRFLKLRNLSSDDPAKVVATKSDPNLRMMGIAMAYPLVVSHSLKRLVLWKVCTMNNTLEALATFEPAGRDVHCVGLNETRLLAFTTTVNYHCPISPIITRDLDQLKRHPGEAITDRMIVTKIPLDKTRVFYPHAKNPTSLVVQDYWRGQPADLFDCDNDDDCVHRETISGAPTNAENQGWLAYFVNLISRWIPSLHNHT